MLRAKFLGLFLLLVIVPLGCTPTSVVSREGVPSVRVQILNNQQQVTLTASTAPTVSEAGQRVPRALGIAPGQQVPITLAPDGWRIGGTRFGSGELTVMPQVVGSVAINGLAYRGNYRFVPTSGDRFDVINDVDVDSYLMGVVSKELLPDWAPEAYKAQAIVARTYALYEVSTARRGHFDLFPDERSQVYGGFSAETEKSRQGVLQTAGIVVAYGPAGQEKIFKAYFSSCCGGTGQSAYHAFGEADIPPLRAKHVGTLCSASSRFNWGPIEISRDELTRRMRAWGANANHPLKNITSIAKVDIAPGGMRGDRPVRFMVTDAKGQQYSLSGEEFRWACNADAKGGPKLNSSFVKPAVEGNSVRFTDGHGWGHGVGMCQWCAQAWAIQGQRHEAIVRASYPGAVLVRAY
jgi:stage II sporulation protein D